MSRPLSRPSVALAIVAIVGALLSARSAGAFCRAVTSSPPAGYDPATQGCFGTEADGGLYPLFWRNQCVGYSFEEVPSKDVSLADATRVAAVAFGAWSQAACPSGGSPSIYACRSWRP